MNREQLLKDLHTLQQKAISFFDEAQEDSSEHGAGFFFIAKKMDKVIGNVTGIRNSKNPLMSISDLKKSIKEITQTYGDQYTTEVEVTLTKSDTINYSCKIYGTIKGKEERYSDYESVYNTSDFNSLLEKVKEIMENEKIARESLPEQDVAVE